MKREEKGKERELKSGTLGKRTRDRGKRRKETNGKRVEEARLMISDRRGRGGEEEGKEMSGVGGQT